MIKRLKRTLNWFETHNKVSWIITIGIAIFIFYMSSRTFPPGIPGISFNSYIYHWGIYFLFSFSLSISLTKGKIKNKYLILISMLISIGYGISDEIHQFFVPGRYTCYEDVITNSIGTLLSGIFYLRINFKNRKNINQNLILSKSNKL